MNATAYDHDECDYQISFRKTEAPPKNRHSVPGSALRKSDHRNGIPSGMHRRRVRRGSL